MGKIKSRKIASEKDTKNTRRKLEHKSIIDSIINVTLTITLEMFKFSKTF